MKTPEQLANDWIATLGLEESLLRLRKKLRYLIGAHPSYRVFWTQVEVAIKSHHRRFLEGHELHAGLSEGEPCPGCGRAGRECWAAPCLYLVFVKERPLLALREWCETTGGTLVSRKDAQSEGR
jgi:hypothetical protein